MAQFNHPKSKTGNKLPNATKKTLKLIPHSLCNQKIVTQSIQKAMVLLQMVKN